MFEDIHYSSRDGVATITLDRPDKLNALTERTVDELVTAPTRADDDDQVCIVIVTGAGRAFCAGVDLTAVPRGGNPFVSTGEGGHRDPAGRIAMRLLTSRKIVIGAVNGAAIGASASILLPMDIRLAATDAKFGFAFTARGITPEGAATWFLPRIVGISRGVEMIATARTVDAKEALDAGLIQSVHAGDALLPAALQLARAVAERGATMAVALSRRMLWRSLSTQHPVASHVAESRSLEWLAATGDPIEGVASFREKRPAHFPLRVPNDWPDFDSWWSDE